MAPPNRAFYFKVFYPFQDYEALFRELARYLKGAQ
jgi:hypothetical protein